MRLRWPVAASLAPVGLLIGALIVGPPDVVPNDVVLVDVPTTTTTVPATTTTAVVESNGPDPSGPTADVTTTTTIAATTTTIAVIRSDVRIVVANGTPVVGLAGNTADALGAAGFTNTATTDTAPLDTTVVYAKPGFEAAAALVAQTLGLPPETVQPYPGTTFTSIDGDGDVIILVGADRAG